MPNNAAVGGLEEKRLIPGLSVERLVCFLLVPAHTPRAHPLIRALVPVTIVARVAHPLKVLEKTAVPIRGDVVHDRDDDDGPAGVLEALHLFLHTVVQHPRKAAVSSSRAIFE